MASSGLPAAAAADPAGAAVDGVTPPSLQDLILELSPPSLEPPPSSASFARHLNWCQILTTAVAAGFVLAWVFLRLIHIMAVIYGKWRLHKKTEALPTGDTPPPGVSILKPLTASGDPNLFTNLETYFMLEYPKYELLICIQDPKDFQLREYIAKLRKKYP